MLIATLSAEQKRKEKKKWREREKKKRRGALCPAMAMGFLFNRLLQIAFFLYRITLCSIYLASYKERVWTNHDK